MIKFGTDGWRALIARDYTFENLHYIALATARYLNNTVQENPSAVIGYDTRFLSKEFAEEVARVLAWQGITVHITDTHSSTPQVSYHTKQKGANLGIVITASHNPPIYNGFKLKAHFGGPATPDQIKEVEKYLKRILGRPPQIKIQNMEDYVKLKKIRPFDAKESYLRYLKKKINVKEIIDAGYKVLFDPMYGAGIDTIKRILPDADEIHDYYNPCFGGLERPEPIKEHLQETIDKVKSEGYDIALAADGDADRLGVIDEEGNFVDSHKVFIILMKYLYEKRNKRGSVVKTVSLTSMVDKYCEAKNLKLHKTPVGFKYAAQLMSEEKVLIGGEESGGLGTALHIPERDGLFNGLLLLEVMAVEKKSIKKLCEDLDQEFGKHRYSRRDVPVTPEDKEKIMNACKKKPNKLGRYEVERIDTTDGCKFFVKNGWLLIRPSGTEPLIRFYAEANSLNKVNELLDEGLKIHK